MNRYFEAALLLSALFSLSACNVPTEETSRLSRTDKEKETTARRTAPLFKETESCRSSDPERICLGVKYVVYRSDSGRAFINLAQARENIRKATALWDPCGIAFQLETYEEVDPFEHGLPAAGARAQESSFEVRREFEDDHKLLIVQTGPWNVDKHAWTATPGSPPYGVVMSQDVASSEQILAHELGHYLNLDHSDDPDNLLSTITYPGSSKLSRWQCRISRDTALRFWPHMMR